MATQSPQRIEAQMEFPVGAPVAILRNFFELTPFGRANLEAALRVWSMTAKSMFVWQREAADFMCMRTDKVSDLGRRMADAQDMSEVLRLQADYVRSIAEDYVDGATQMLERNVETAKADLSQLRQTGERAAGELEERAQQTREIEQREHEAEQRAQERRPQRRQSDDREANESDERAGQAREAGKRAKESAA
jgi:hypothetical protein